MSSTTRASGAAAPFVNITRPTPITSLVIAGSGGPDATTNNQPESPDLFDGLSRGSSSLTRYAGGKFDDNESEKQDATYPEKDSVPIVLPPKPESKDSAAEERRIQELVEKTRVTNTLTVRFQLGVSTTSEGGLTIATCDDGGRSFEANFLHQNQNLVEERKYDSTRSVIEQVRDDLNANEARLRSAIDPKSFYIPCTHLHSIMTYDTVRLLLHECDDKMSHSEVPRLAREIAPSLSSRDAPSFRRIFALLILIGMPKAILEFCRHNLDDSQLPCNFESEPSPRSPLHPLLKLMLDSNWKDVDIRDFCRLQWEMWPVFFSVIGKKLVHYECRPGEILPFRKINREIKKGGYGEVACYGLHPDQQTLVRYTREGSGRYIAVKKLFRPNNREDFDREYSMLDRLTPLDTPHLAKLLATYEVPKDSGHTDSKDSGHTESKDYFLVFEYSDLTLSDIWKKCPAEWSSGQGIERVAKWIAFQSLGLAQALGRLHEFGNDRAPDDSNPRTHGLHGDLKPENVLYFTNWVDQSAQICHEHILQIIDFGLSSFHHTQTAADIKIKHHAGDYFPPESQMYINASYSFDIWSLGCLYLEFLTWCVFGPDGLIDFKKSRRSPGFIIDTHSLFWEFTRDGKYTVISVSKIVLMQVKDLYESVQSSDFIRDFCTLIINRMLVIEPKELEDQEQNGNLPGTSENPSQRIKTSDLVGELQKLVKDDLNYYEPSACTAPLNLDQQRYCIRIRKSISQMNGEAEERRTLRKAQESPDSNFAQPTPKPVSLKRERSRPVSVWIKDTLDRFRNSEILRAYRPYRPYRPYRSFDDKSS